MKRILFWVWIAAALIWSMGAAYAAYIEWPHLSLDLSHIDAETQAAYNQAVLLHVAKYAAVGILVPLVVLFLGSFFFKRR